MAYSAATARARGRGRTRRREPPNPWPGHSWSWEAPTTRGVPVREDLVPRWPLGGVRHPDSCTLCQSRPRRAVFSCALRAEEASRASTPRSPSAPARPFLASIWRCRQAGNCDSSRLLTAAGGRAARQGHQAIYGTHAPTMSRIDLVRQRALPGAIHMSPVAMQQIDEELVGPRARLLALLTQGEHEKRDFWR